MGLQKFLYHRQALAESIAQGLTGEGLIDYSSGLFLAAPRRTGKSTFLKQDLMPLCTQRGWETVYVDLWTNRQEDPGHLIERIVMRSLKRHEPQLKRLLRAAGVQRISLERTLHWDLDRESLPEGASLAEALEALQAASGRMVVMIVDEAQHALNSDAGINAMFALKAARDALNLGGDSPGLRLILTGSSRDKLAMLVLSRDQPFFGSSVTPFPLLGEDFIEAYTADLNTKLAPGNTFAAKDVYQAFQRVGHRPELLGEVVRRVALELGQAPDLGKLLAQGAVDVQNGLWAEYESAFVVLSPLQRAILRVLAEAAAAGERLAMFSDTTVARINAAEQAEGGKGRVRPQSIQAGLDALRDKSLVWRSGRGAYALEDSGFGEWLLEIGEIGDVP